MASLSNTNLKKRARIDYKIPVLVRFGIEHQPVQYIYIHKNEFKIGRSLGNDEIIPNVSISRFHCVIKQLNSDELSITSVTSSPLGILVNNNKIEHAHILKVGDVIQLVPTPELTFTFGYSDENENTKIKLRSSECTAKKNHQDMEIEDLQRKVQLEKQVQDIIKLRLAELVKTNEKLQGQVEEKNNEIKNLQNQVQSKNDEQTKLQDELLFTLLSLSQERDEYEQLLTAERKNCQDEVNMVKQEKEQLEKKNNLWKEQVTALAKNKDALQSKLNQTKNSLNEQLKGLVRDKGALQLKLNQTKNSLNEQLKALAKDKGALQSKLNQTKNSLNEQLKALAKDKVALQSKLNQAENSLKEQLTALAKDKDTLQSKLNKAENSLKEQALVKKLQVSLQQVVSVDNGGGGQTADLFKEINLSNDDEKNSSCDKEQKDTIIREIDEQFRCSICFELFYKATTLNCSHTFCEYCINRWRERSHDCPICDTNITSMNNSRIINNFIDTIIVNLSSDHQQLRNQVIDKRYTPERKFFKSGRSALPSLRKNAASRRRWNP